MNVRAVALIALPVCAVAAGIALDLAAYENVQTVIMTVTFPSDGHHFRADFGRWRPIPATMSLHKPQRLMLRVINRDTRTHAFGVLSIDPGDSVEARPDACVNGRIRSDLVVLVR